MKSRICLGVTMLVAAGLLVGLYELMPDHQGWVIFGAMVGMGMSLGRRNDASEERGPA